MGYSDVRKLVYNMLDNSKTISANINKVQFLSLDTASSNEKYYIEVDLRIKNSSNEEDSFTLHLKNDGDYFDNVKIAAKKEDKDYSFEIHKTENNNTVNYYLQSTKTTISSVSENIRVNYGIISSLEISDASNVNTTELFEINFSMCSNKFPNITEKEIRVGSFSIKEDTAGDKKYLVFSAITQSASSAEENPVVNENNDGGGS